MTRVVVIEDEPPARDRLVAALQKLDPKLEVVATLASVAESLRWFEQHSPPDLVFADVQLSDGLSLEIFATTAPSFPIVFCTAYDEYLLDALGQNGIAYLLKPYSPAQLREAIDKYRRLEAHFAEKLAAVTRALVQPKPAKRRLLARDGESFVVVALDDVAYFGVRDGLTELVQRDGRRLALDRTLAEVEAELDGSEFFRLNRQYLAHADAVVGFRAWFKGRLLVELQPAAPEEVVVSQPNAARFRSWLAGD
jgi:DNA-binding LytR/AlgR family response regulator